MLRPPGKRKLLVRKQPRASLVQPGHKRSDHDLGEHTSYLLSSQLYTCSACHTSRQTKASVEAKIAERALSSACCCTNQNHHRTNRYRSNLCRSAPSGLIPVWRNRPREHNRGGKGRRRFRSSFVTPRMAFAARAASITEPPRRNTYAPVE